MCIEININSNPFRSALSEDAKGVNGNKVKDILSSSPFGYNIHIHHHPGHDKWVAFLLSPPAL